MTLDEAKKIHTDPYSTHHDRQAALDWALAEIERLTAKERVRDESADLILGICEGLMATPNLSAIRDSQLLREAAASADAESAHHGLTGE